MAEIKWIKLNIDMFDDEKIKLIQAMPEGDAILLLWIKLILLAGKTNDGGYVYINENMPYTEEMLSIITNKPLPIVRLALETFQGLGMIENDSKGIYLVNFEKHQSLDKMEQIKEQNRLRQQRFREKKKLEKDVTLRITQSNAIDIDIDKDIDKDIKENNKRKIFKKPTSEEVDTYIKDNNLNVNVQNFIDYYESNGWKVGHNSMKDWKATLRRWSRTNKVDDKRPSWIDKEIKREEATDEELKELDKLLEDFK